MKPKLKKMFALVTAFMMALSIVTPNFAKAADKPVISVEATTATGGDLSKLNRGDEVTVNVKLNTNSVQKLSVLQLSVHFDPEVFEAVGTPQMVMPKNGGTGLVGISKEKSTLNISYTVDVANPDAQIDYDGVVYTAKLKVKDNAKAGSTTLAFDTSDSEAMYYSDQTVADVTLTGKDLGVVSPLKSISFNGVADEATINLGATETLTVVYNPEDTTDDKTVTWNSTNTNAVTVDNGVVTAVGEGSSTVTATVGEKVATINYTVRIPLQSITINGDETLSKNEEKTLTVTYNPTNTTDNKTVDWESSNPEIVSIDSTGKITGKKGGTAKITATVGNVKAEKEVKVVVPIESVSLSGDEFKFSATYTPENTTDENKTVEWSSSNTDVGTIDQEGNFVALKEGTTKITAKIGNIKAEREVTVIENHVGDFKLLQEEGEVLNIGNTQKLVTVVNPENCTDAYTIKYSSSDEAIATVDENGNVTALKDGKVVITATLTTEYDEEFEDSIEINIPAKEVISNKAEDGTTNGAATQEATSPKTGDVTFVLVSVLMLGAATTLVVTKRRSVKQK